MLVLVLVLVLVRVRVRMRVRSSGTAGCFASASVLKPRSGAYVGSSAPLPLRLLPPRI